MKRWIALAKEELIVLFGYFTGLFIQVGFFMDPELYYPDNVFWAWKAQIETAIPDIYIRTTIALIILLLLGLAVKRAYVLGGPAAIIAVAMGFLAGLSTPTDLAIGLAMLLLAVLSAYISGWGWRAPERPQG